jgi:hypothetical protein
MPKDYGNVGTGYIYNDHKPDLPKGDPDLENKEVTPWAEKDYGYDWPGIGPPPRTLPEMAPPERYKRYWEDGI